MNVLLSLLLLGSVATVYGASTSRIVNGTNAPEGIYPYMVAISKGGKHHCGGSILNKRYILTAAHCIRDQTSTNLRVKYGTTVWNDTSVEWREIEELIPHEEYDFPVFQYDVGLIKLKEEIVFNEKVQPVNLPTSDHIDGKYTAVTTGWGRISLVDPPPNDLQQIALNVIPHEDCAVKMGASRHHICTFTQRGEGICFGDSGGPLVAGQYQIGIASYVRPCALGSPDVFARVYSFLDWIEQHSSL